MVIYGQFLGILLKACSVPHLPRAEPNYPQSYPQFRWKITLRGLKITSKGSVCPKYGIRLVRPNQCSFLNRLEACNTTNPFNPCGEAEPVGFQAVRKSRLPRQPTQDRLSHHRVPA
jgi:hypothetical protein